MYRERLGECFSLPGICNDLQISLRDLFPILMSMLLKHCFYSRPAVSPCLGPLIKFTALAHGLSEGRACDVAKLSKHRRHCRVFSDVYAGFCLLNTKHQGHEVRSKAAICFQNEAWIRTLQSWKLCLTAQRHLDEDLTVPRKALLRPHSLTGCPSFIPILLFLTVSVLLNLPNAGPLMQLLWGRDLQADTELECYESEIYLLNESTKTVFLFFPLLISLRHK